MMIIIIIQNIFSGNKKYLHWNQLPYYKDRDASKVLSRPKKNSFHKGIRIVSVGYCISQSYNYVKLKSLGF